MRLPFSSSITVLFASLCAGSSYQAAKLLDYAEQNKDQAGRSYVCVETRAPDRILIAEAPHDAELKSLAGTSVLVKYDDDYLWLRPPHGRTRRLRQDYLTRAFAPGSPCEQIIEAAWMRLTAPPKKLLMRQSH